MKMIKNFLSLILVLCLTSATVVKAESFTDYNGYVQEAIELSDSVYVDGIEFNINLDLETGNITVLGNTDISMGELILKPDGDAIVNIENNGIADEYYTLEIESLSKNNVDIDIYDEKGVFVTTYQDYDEIMADTYVGQEAITWSLIITGAILLTAVIASECIIYISNVLYIMADKFYNTVSRAVEAVKTRAYNYYYPAYIDSANYIVYISPKGISLTSAANKIAGGGHVYSFTSSMAKSVINSAGYIACDSSGQQTSEFHRRTGRIVFRHWHRGRTNSRGNIVKYGDAHSLFGAGIV